MTYGQISAVTYEYFKEMNRTYHDDDVDGAE